MRRGPNDLFQVPTGDQGRLEEGVGGGGVEQLWVKELALGRCEG